MTEKNGQYKIGVEKRLTALEVSFNGFKEVVEAEFIELKTNHLSHMDEKIDKLAGRMWWFVALAITVLVGIVIDFGKKLIFM